LYAPDAMITVGECEKVSFWEQSESYFGIRIMDVKMVDVS